MVANNGRNLTQCAQNIILLGTITMEKLNRNVKQTITASFQIMLILSLLEKYV